MCCDISEMLWKGARFHRWKVLHEPGRERKKTSRNMQQSPSFTGFHKFSSKLFTLVFTDLCLCFLYRFIMLSSSCFIMVLCQTSSSCGSSLASLSNASMAVRSLRKTPMSEENVTTWLNQSIEASNMAFRRLTWLFQKWRSIWISWNPHGLGHPPGRKSWGYHNNWGWWLGEWD